MAAHLVVRNDEEREEGDEAVGGGGERCESQEGGKREGSLYGGYLAFCSERGGK